MRLPLMMLSNLKSEQRSLHGDMRSCIEGPVPETADPRKEEHETMLPSQRWWQIPRQLSRVIS
jgi:hypothetical protein